MTNRSRSTPGQGPRTRQRDRRPPLTDLVCTRRSTAAARRASAAALALQAAYLRHVQAPAALAGGQDTPATGHRRAVVLALLDDLRDGDQLGPVEHGRRRTEATAARTVADLQHALQGLPWGATP